MLDIVYVAAILAVFGLVAPGRLGSREAVIGIDVLAVVLGVAAVAYLVYALVKPERF